MHSVTIGIPTYNAQDNIIALLDSIHAQKGSLFTLKNILVYDDLSTDNTRQLVANYTSPLVRLIRPQKRRGFAYGVRYLLHASSTDLTVLLNDDVTLRGTDFLEKTVKPFTECSRVGLVCANPQPYPPQNFIQRAIESGFRAYERAKLEIRDGNSPLTCDGKSLLFSRPFVRTIVFPRDLATLGNVDTYMYCLCVKNGFEYRFVRSAFVGFKNPDTLSDLVQWTRRNNESILLIRKRFGSILDDDFNAVKHLFTKHKIIELFKNPVGCFLLAAVTAYCSVAISLTPATFNPRWDIVRSTKQISKTHVVSRNNAR